MSTAKSSTIHETGYEGDLRIQNFGVFPIILSLKVHRDEYKTKTTKNKNSFD